MKLFRLLTVAAGAAIVSSPAFAQVEVRISGASALQVSLEKAVAGAICTAPGTKYVGSLGTTYVCNTAQGLATIRKRDSGGSAFGVLNLNNPANTLTFVATTGCTTVGTAGAATVAGIAGWTLNSGCPATPALPVMYGVSDVEARLFAGQGAVNNVASTPLLAQVFGIAVSDKLYAKLQTIQGTSGVPSLRSVDIRSIMIGNYRDWTQVEPTITANAGGTTAIKLCRRVATSGTQATFNALFLNNPCGAPNDAQLVPADNLTDDAPGNDSSAGSLAKTDVYTVVMNSAAGNVDQCLTSADAQNELALGLLGTERVPGAGGTGGDDPDGAADSWKFVAIDGKAATVANAIAGNYEYVAEATWNRNPAIPYTAAQEAIANAMIVNMGSPATITAEGLLGVAAIPDNGFDPTIESPVLFGSRGGNTCRPMSNSY